MRKLTITILLLLTLVAGSSLAASCATGEVTKTATTTITATVTQPPGTTTQPPTTQAVTTTAGELASSGATLYNNSCVLTYCHESWEPDGKMEFINAGWAYFGNAQAYFDFTKRFMPGESPGSLSEAEYLQAIAYILVGTDKVQAGDLFGMGNLGSISLN